MESKKKVYNVFLNSKDTASFTGTKENAQYFVDFTNIMNPESLNSSYLVRFRIKSLLIGTAGYNPTSNLIVLNLGFSSRSCNMSNRTNSRTAGVLSFNWESQVTVTTNTYSVDTRPSTNPPMYIDNLSSSNTISFNLYDVNSLANFSNVTHYVSILSFEEQ